LKLLDMGCVGRTTRSGTCFPKRPTAGAIAVVVPGPTHAQLPTTTVMTLVRVSESAATLVRVVGAAEWERHGAGR